jgi:hypothetical protein
MQCELLVNAGGYDSWNLLFPEAIGWSIILYF